MCLAVVYSLLLTSFHAAKYFACLEVIIIEVGNNYSYQVFLFGVYSDLEELGKG